MERRKRHPLALAHASTMLVFRAIQLLESNDNGEAGEICISLRHDTRSGDQPQWVADLLQPWSGKTFYTGRGESATLAMLKLYDNMLDKDMT